MYQTFPSDARTGLAAGKASLAQQLNLRIPVVSAPMFLVSGPELVVAACKMASWVRFPRPMHARSRCSTTG